MNAYVTASLLRADCIRGRPGAQGGRWKGGKAGRRQAEGGRRKGSGREVANWGQACLANFLLDM